MNPLKALLATYQQRIESALEQWLPAPDRPPTRLHEAMRYAALGGGKRIRPVLVYATGQALGVALDQLDAPACAVECIHAYSLVHDDLPAMDDDELRRGRPTCHIAFDEATAILAGDGLQACAFEILASGPSVQVEAARRLRMLHELAIASGAQGMVGGQALDIEATGRTLPLDNLQHMHRCKTGALIRVSVRLGALSCTSVSDAQLATLDTYADAIGLAFQIRDDILDVESDTATLGKPQGSDAARDKLTYTSLLGLDGAKHKARELHQLALHSLEGFDAAADPLRWISEYIVERAH